MRSRTHEIKYPVTGYEAYFCMSYIFTGICLPSGKYLSFSIARGNVLYSTDVGVAAMHPQAVSKRESGAKPELYP
jgi:hypothetical protein